MRLKEDWKTIDGFEDYSVSNFGNVRKEKTGRILSTSPNQYNVVQVGLMRDGIQYHRSIPLLVAKAFLPSPYPAYDTPINLDGDRQNNYVGNLMWRPRWFAIKYNQQFRYPSEHHIMKPIVDIKTNEVSENSLEASKQYGLLETDLVFAILNRTYVWPTYQEFGIVEN